jgi:Nuclease-related domain/Topoisomerase DNA binding C4 zinc finger
LFEDSSALSFVILIVFAVLAFASLLRHLPSVSGKRGESRIARKLGRLEKDRYIVLNDLLISTPTGTSQIDHVVLSRSGIHVIETKNYSGWIHGSEGSGQWTQSIYRTKNRFPNPLKQNWGHVRALKQVLSELGDIPVYPIVVFAGSAELKNVKSQSPVVYGSELLKIIRKNKEFSLSRDQVREIEEKLVQSNMKDRFSKKAHINQIRTRPHQSRQREKELICPACGGRLVSRTGKFGSFYGCNNYPRCRYTFR